MKKNKILISLFIICTLFFNVINVFAADEPDLNLSSSQMTCADLLGPNLTKVVSAGIQLIMIAGAIIAIVNGMITLIPAITSKDADGLKKASKKLVSMAVILAIIFLLPSLLRIIGNILGFDISCIV